jgi:DNA polymerase III delta subunit
VVVEGWLTRLLGRAGPAAEQEEAEGEAGEEDAPRTGGSAKEMMAALVAYAPDLPESTALVLVEPRDLPKSNAVVKAAEAAEWGYVKQFPLAKGDALAPWVRKRAKAAGGEFSREAAQALVEVEDDPRALGNEILKLLAYVGYERTVEIEDVQSLTPARAEAVIWDLVDAVGQRRGPQAMRLLHTLLETEEPLYVLTMIVRQYRFLLQAKEMLGPARRRGKFRRRWGCTHSRRARCANRRATSRWRDWRASIAACLNTTSVLKQGRWRPARRWTRWWGR